ncbi:MAG: glycosyltransferase, partial [Phycisphaeraceae bacterium]
TGHFIRGVAGELVQRGHAVRLLEAAGASPTGTAARQEMTRLLPGLETGQFDGQGVDLWWALRGADLVIVHEAVGLPLARQIGAYRSRSCGFRLLLHAGTHASSGVGEAAMAGLWDLPGYDGVLNGGAARHEHNFAHRDGIFSWRWTAAVNANLFDSEQVADTSKQGDAIWVGHWSGGRREKLLRELFVQPLQTTGLTGCVCGGGYPPRFRRLLHDAGIRLEGVVPNRRLPRLLSRHRVAFHLEAERHRAPADLPMRMMEAMACAVPVIVAGPLPNFEGLTAGVHFAHAPDGPAMAQMLQTLINDHAAAERLTQKARTAMLTHHTCTARVDQLLAICHDMGMASPAQRKGSTLDTEAAKPAP